MINGNNYRTLVLILLLVLPFGAAQAQQADTLCIRFRLDSISIDMDYADNAKAWQTFERNFLAHYANVSPLALRLDIYSGASPEGTAAHNRWLGENRGQAIRRLVRQQLPGRIGSIIVHNEAARWDGLYEAVAASQEPWRDQVLRIIEQPASSDDNRWDDREYKLRALQGGGIWPVLLQKYLAPLRSGATAVLSWEPGRDTIIVRDTVIIEQPARIPANVVYADSLGYLRRAPDNARVHKPVVRYPVWIMRTNLPLLATGTPNLQLEFSLDHKDKWSFNIEGVWSWWTFAHNDFANEIIYGSVELRRWLGRRWRHHSLDGWHIGLGVGGGYGDLEWTSRGYQGEAISGFLNIGWQRRFGRRKQWAFDAGIGLGYAFVKWRRYTGSRLFPVDKEEEHSDHLMWRETGRNHWIGTPHFNISLGYVFPQKDARWRRAQAMERDAVKYDYLHFRDSMKAREKYIEDSAKTARKLRLKEINMLPRKERKVALAELAAADKLAKENAKTAKRMAKNAKKWGNKVPPPRTKAERRERKAQLKAEKEARQQQEREMKRWAKTPEGREAVRREILAEKAARRQAKLEAKQAKKQRKLDRKVSRMKARIEAEHRRHLEKYQRDMEKADYKYSVK